jgi:cell wall-associated NlpC family hydrolase
MIDQLRAALHGRIARFTLQQHNKAKHKKHANKKNGKKNGKKKPPSPPVISPPVSPPVSSPPPPGGPRLDSFLACLRQSIGGKYCSPAREPDCTDCSGLVRRCYLEATGTDLGGDSHEQFKLRTEISRGNVQPGDLLFWDTQHGAEVRGGNAASHVGVASGGNHMINALNDDLGILESDLGSDYWTHQVVYLGARRLEF